MKPQNLIRLGLFCFLVLLIVSLFASSAQINSDAQTKRPSVEAASPAANAALERLQQATDGEVESQVARQTGYYSFVRAERGAVLSADDASATPEARAFSFLSTHGALVGMTDGEREPQASRADRDKASASQSANASPGSELRVAKVDRDSIGITHVRLDQFYRDLPVFGAQLIVHMNERGITAINGVFVPDITVSTTPKIAQAKAEKIALAVVTKRPDASLKTGKTELAIYRMGLLEGYKADSVLAYAVEVSGTQKREQVWVNAHTGNVLIRIPLLQQALHRIVYSPEYDPANPNDNIVKEEGDGSPTPPPPADPVNNLYHYTGQTYFLFLSAFGRDSYDGIGTAPQRTVLLANDQCPNAYWDGQATNYCPDFDKDDIVAHEWGHAYTQYTHNLIYAYQSGALNESYSDIFGETIDLNNGADGAAGGNNSQPTTYTFQNGQYVVTPPDPANGTRWRVGEDVQGLSQPAALGILRDMWFPPAFGDPDKTSSANYHCDASDGGGVHTNSGVPNHAFAILVDGKTFNGVTVQAIGFVRALHIYFRAMTQYQTETTNFAEHQQALQASCRDLIGVPLNNFSTISGTATPSLDVITQATCTQVDNAMAAVEMSRDVFAQCNFQKILDPVSPPECAGSDTIFVEDWESGMNGWTVANQGTGAGWAGTNWTLKSPLPVNIDGSAHSGTAAFAINPRIGEPNGGDCAASDVSGQFWMDSPTITIPSGASDLKLKFDHFVQTETGFDGGNVKISVNGGAFALVPQGEYDFNAPPSTLDPGPTNTNPKAGEFAWHGTNEGELTGSWGTTIIDLSNLTNPGDTIKVRWDFGQDGCNGNLGWLVDTVRVYACPTLNPPVLSAGADYENPDTNGSFTLNWTRPGGATGPDTLQQSTSCGPVFFDDASETLVAGDNTKWNGTAQWSSQTNPSDSSSSYYIPDGALQDDSLVMINSVAIPAGASSTLTFTTRQGLENTFDFGNVEVSTDGGTNFVEVASYTGPEGNLTPADVFEGPRTVDLSQFAGQSIKVRFRVTSDPFNIGQPAGWYIDNIGITASNFADVVTVPGTSQTLSRSSGSYCYRVRTIYSLLGQPVQSPYSNVVNINVAAPTASDGVVTGRIVDNNGMPVEGAVVRLSGTQNRKFITDANGLYRFDKVETGGFYTVTPTRANYTISPSSRSFSQIGETTEAAFSATATSGGFVNPLDTPEYFVRQHYLDFLGREPDEAGFNFWSDQILECANDNQCIERRRENVSAAYFLSIEFQQTGGLVDRLYKASYGARPQFAEFMPDTRAVGLGVVVGRTGWQAKLEANKQAFVEAFVQRPAFHATYDGLSNSDYVDALISHAGVRFTSGEREELVSGLANGTLTRSAVLRSIAEDGRFVSAKFNEAFVMMEYFGYLRRDPDESGYQFWLAKLNQFNGNFEQAEMVKAFLVSGEYRQRFAGSSTGNQQGAAEQKTEGTIGRASGLFGDFLRQSLVQVLVWSSSG